MSAFRSTYLRYEELTKLVHDWARAHPEFVRVKSIGKSLEGRDFWLLEIGREPDRRRAAAWIDGNMHASELCGSSVALAIAEDAIALHRGDNRHDLPAHVVERLKSILFYVLPRMSPDGAEAVLRDGRYVRSNPRDRREHAPVPRWVAGDVDGDGAVLSLRKEDPSGEFVQDPEIPGVMLPRRLEDTGPFYKVWPEGTIENYDGTHVPDPHYLADNDVDLNRNFPYAWRPEHEQVGAGSYGASEPESRAVIDWATAHPNIFSWLNLHTFGGCYIRPLGNAADNKMNQEDLALYRQIGEWGENIGGYPMVSGFEEFIYEPEKPIYGDITDFIYHTRGAIAYACELWDLFARLGIARKKPFVDHYSKLTRENLLALAKFDRESNKGRIFRPWKRFKHPQLGEVELGGTVSTVGLSNPPYEVLPEVCQRQAAVYLRVAAMAPALEMKARYADGRLEVEVANAGYLPTYVLDSAKKLALDARVFVEFEPQGGVTLEPRDARVEVGHLEGWGRGLYNEYIFFQRSRGSVSRRTVSIPVRGKGRVRVRAKGLRVGELVEELAID
ncbi:MAG: peptidase M14 [Betaproteobacteria bacterium]|nr:peptidase M14 [Betaproteobacteria bacterium]